MFKWTVSHDRKGHLSLNGLSLQICNLHVFKRWGFPLIGLFATFSNQKCRQFLCPRIRIHDRPLSMQCQSHGTGWEQCTLSHYIQDDPSSNSQTQTVPFYHFDLVGSVLIGRILDAGATTVDTRQTHSCSGQEQTSHSTRSSTRWMPQEPDLTLLKPTCVETMRALFKKLFYSEHASELMTST